MKIMPLSLIAILVTGLFLFTATQYQSVTPVLAADSLFSSTYIDADGDGQVDHLKWMWDENITACPYEAGDWSIDTAGSINVSAITGINTSDPESTGEGACNNSDGVVYISVTADGGITGGTTDPVVSYTQQGVSDIVGATTNPISSQASQTQSDGAAPVINDFLYEDNNGDGYVDQFNVGFSETVTAASTLGASDLLITNAGDFTSAAFGAGADLISGSVSQVTVALGTPSSVIDTRDDSTNLAISTQASFSLTDGTNTNATTGAQSNATFSDGAAPVNIGGGYLDNNGDGQIDRVNLGFSENVSYTYDDTDWSATAQGLTGFDVSGCISCTTTSPLVLTATANADLTGVSGGTEPDLQFTPPNNISDADSNNAAGFTITGLNDGAAPVPIFTEYWSTAGAVDAVAIDFSEQISTNTAVLGDFAYVANDITNSTIVGGTYNAETGATTVTIDMGTNGDAGITSHSTAPTIAYTDGGGTEISDSIGNQVASFGATNLSDGAAPALLAAITQDTDSNGKLDHLELQFTEAIDDSAINNYNAGTDYTPTSFALANVTGEAVEATEGTCDNDAAEDDAYLCISFTEDAGTCGSAGTGGCDTDATDQDVTWTAASATILDAAGNGNEVEHNVVTGTIVESDGAPAAIVDMYYYSSGNNGTVDRFDVVFSEACTWNGNSPNQFQINNQNLTGFDSDTEPNSFTGTGTDTFTMVTSGTTNLTGVSGGTEPTTDYAQAGTSGDRIKDAVGNDLLAMGATTIDDDAAPFLQGGGYEDNNGDGQVDRVNLGFSENITYTYDDTDWVATANNLTSFDVTACTSCTNVQPLVLTATAAADTTGVSGQTEPNLQFTPPNNIADGDGNNSAGFTITGLQDVAAPVVVDYEYRDNGDNGSVDRLNVVYSEYVYWNTSDANQWAIVNQGLTGYDDDGTVDSHIGGGGGSFNIQFSTAGTTNLTGVSGGTEPTVEYTQSGTPANRVNDGNGNDAPSDGAPVSMTDDAIPVRIGNISYLDGNGDGQIETTTLNYTENVTYTYADANWTAVANGLGTYDVTACTACTNVSTLQLTTNALANITGVSGGTEPTLAYAAGNNISDSTGNDAADITATSLVDGAAPILNTAEYLDANGDGTVERIRTSWTEAVTMTGSTGVDWTVTGGDITAAFSSAPDDAGGNYLVDVMVTADATETGSTANVQIAYDNDDANGSLTDGTNPAGTNAAVTATDGAAPIVQSAQYLDNNTDGAVDRVEFTTTADTGIACTAFTGATDFTVGTAGEVGLAEAAGDTCASNGTSTITITLATAGTANTTGGATSPVVTYTQPGDGVEDGAGNDLPTAAGVTVADGALPLFTSSVVDDTNSDGTIDQATITYTEAVAITDGNAGDAFPGVTFADSCVAANADYASGGTTTSVVTLNSCNAGGITADPTYASAAGQIQDVVAGEMPNGETVVGTDASKPVPTSATFYDGNGDGKLDLITVVWSKNLSAVADGSADWALTSAANFAGIVEGTVECNSGAAGATECDYNFTTTTEKTDVGDLTLTYSGTSVTDGTNAADPTAFTSASSPAFTDAASPIVSTSTITLYDVAGGDAIVDRLVATYTEPLADNADAAGDWAATTNDHDSGGTCVVAAADPDGTSTLNVDLTCDTQYGDVGDLSAAFTQSGNTLEDAAGNDVASKTYTAASTPPIVNGVTPGALTSTNVEPATLDPGASGTATVTFTTVKPVLLDGKIKVTFGANYDVSGAANGDCTSMDGTFVTSVAGQVVTLTRQSDGADEAPGAQTCTIDTIVNPAAAGSTGTYDITTSYTDDVVIDQDAAVAADTIASAVVITQCNDGLDNDGNGLIDYPNDPYCSSAADTLEAYEGGGGGGGGGGGAATTSTSNTTTTTVVANITTITGDQTYSSPVQFDEEDIVVDEDNGTASVEFTGDGTFTMKPNSKSTISVHFPEETDVTGPADWNGRIDPPVLRSLTMISKSGEEIEGTDDLLMRDDVTAIVKVGATVPLEFSNEVTLEIPLDLPDGSVVILYTSSDGNTWEPSGEGVVQDGKLIVKTDHFSYFAVVPGEGVVPITVEKGFGDIVGHWAEDFINEIFDLGIVSGKTETTYAPNDQITRAELTKIATKSFGIEIDPVPTFTPFGDVGLTAWFAPYVIAAREAGIVEGVSEGVFSPNAPITRAAALKIMLESAGFDDIDEAFDTGYANKAGYNYASFPDVGLTDWFAKYVTYAADNGVVNGKTATSFAPGDSITRAEVAKIVVKVMELLEQ